jgi:hypothetical protein
VTVHKTPDRRCRICGELHNSTRNAQEGHTRPPQPGDFSICINCAAISVFTEDLGLRAPTDEERGEVVDEPMMMTAITFIKLRGRREVEPECI